jgi:hypothetical protein
VTPKPLLVILAENDRCTYTEVQREVYDSAPHASVVGTASDPS